MKKSVEPTPQDTVESAPLCFHCGLPCSPRPLLQDDRPFCCAGCIAVYELLQGSGMDRYYDLALHPGRPGEEGSVVDRFAYLDDDELADRLCDFRTGTVAQVTLEVPSIHCVSCIWLLENLYQLHGAIRSCQVNFLRREVTVTFDEIELPLGRLVALITSLGYEPRLQLDALGGDGEVERDYRDELIRLGVAAFCFGNIMLYSFPEYLAGDMVPHRFQLLFSYLSFFLAIPSLFYAGWDWLKKAFLSVRHGFLSMDVPISLGLLTLFGWSSYEVLAQVGPGYFDSLAGFVFFLLIGRYFQRQTFDHLSFQRDYTAYFPLAVQRERSEGGEESVSLGRLEPGDVLVVRNQELLPADGTLLSDEATIDYSFITGESEPVVKVEGDEVLAGGRVVGGAVRMEVAKKVHESFFVGLWNDDMAGESAAGKASLADVISPYFTATVLAIALVSSLIWWWGLGQGRTALFVFSSVLIVACPCALALSTPFTQGALLRRLGKGQVFLRNGEVLDRLAAIDTVVFDKTGTLTQSGVTLEVVEENLRREDKKAVAALARQSIHPVSRALVERFGLASSGGYREFSEVPGCGLEGTIDGTLVRLGRLNWVDGSKTSQEGQLGISIDGSLRAVYRISTNYRPGWQDILAFLGRRYDLHLLSGDTDGERSRLAGEFPFPDQLHFELDPREKSDYIRELQGAGKVVAMVGDGLNDAGALRHSHVGVAVMEDSSHFSPACDCILLGGNFHRLPAVFELGRQSQRIIRQSFGLSLVYNGVGLSFAVLGALSPLVAAILMPLSSVSVMAFTTFAAGRAASKWDLLEEPRPI